jgi:hypothetical protein
MRYGGVKFTLLLHACGVISILVDTANGSGVESYGDDLPIFATLVDIEHGVYHLGTIR